MSQLPTNRSTSNTVQEHTDDHNELHRLHNVYDGTAPTDFEHVSNKGATSGYAALSGGVVPTSQLGSGTANSTVFLRGDQTWAAPPGGGGGGGGFDAWTVTSPAGTSRTINGDGTALKRYQYSLDQATCAFTVSLLDNEQADISLIQGGGGNKAATWSGVTTWLTSNGSAPSQLAVNAGAVDRLYFERANGVTYGYWLSEPIANANAPWIINLHGYAYSASSTAFPNAAVDTAWVGNYHQDFTGTQNDWLAWDVVIGAGTWKITSVIQVGGTNGIISWQINDVEQVTTDCYNASITNSIITTTGTFTTAAYGKVRLKAKMANKNASSAGYGARISQVTLIRTA